MLRAKSDKVSKDLNPPPPPSVNNNTFIYDDYFTQTDLAEENMGHTKATEHVISNTNQFVGINPLLHSFLYSEYGGDFPIYTPYIQYHQGFLYPQYPMQYSYQYRDGYGGYSYSRLMTAFSLTASLSMNVGKGSVGVKSTMVSPIPIGDNLSSFVGNGLMAGSSLKASPSINTGTGLNATKPLVKLFEQ